MIPIPRMDKYMDINMSSAPPIDDAVSADEVSGATSATASCSLDGGGRGAP
jgi:hypothetical protein